MRPIIWTLSTHEHHPGLQRFQRSCLDKGWQMDLRLVSTLNESEMWRMFWASLDGYRAEGYTHALRLDAWDTIALGPPADLARALAAYDSPALLISAELAAWPGDYRKEEYQGTTPWKYAHSPLTVDLSQELDPAVFHNTHEGYGADQKHFADLILSKIPGVAHDTQCRVVLALGHAHPWQEHFDRAGGRVRNVHTDSWPLFTHGNGRTDDTWVMPL